MLFVSVLILVGLIRLLHATNQPLLCSGIYTAVRLLFAVAFGVPLWALLLGAVVHFGVGSLYFWLLDQYEDVGLAYWPILIAGLLALVYF